MSGTTTTVHPNVFSSNKAVDLEEAVQPAASLDLDGKLEEENFGKDVINENVTVADVSTPLSKETNKKKK